jgi:hypothetical protein
LKKNFGTFTTNGEALEEALEEVDLFLPLFIDRHFCLFVCV